MSNRITMDFELLLAINLVLKTKTVTMKIQTQGINKSGKD